MVTINWSWNLTLINSFMMPFLNIEAAVDPNPLVNVNGPNSGLLNGQNQKAQWEAYTPSYNTWIQMTIYLAAADFAARITCGIGPGMPAYCRVTGLKGTGVQSHPCLEDQRVPSGHINVVGGRYANLALQFYDPHGRSRFRTTTPDFFYQ